MIYVAPTRIEIKTAPSGLPVSVADVKQRARMDAGDTMLDVTILAYIKAVWSKVEEYTGLALLTTEFKAFYDSFPVVMSIQKAPNVVIQKIEYYDVSGALKTLDNAVYQIQKKMHLFNVFAKEFQCLPDVQNHSVDSVVVYFSAGWNGSSNIPDDIKEAIINAVVAMLTGGAGNECQNECSLPGISKSLLYKYRDLMSLMR